MSVSLLLLLAAGCASNLELSREVTDPGISDLRSVYIKSFPNSPYLTHVYRNEVVAGMDMFGVLASWGQPQGRTRQSVEVEQWVYYDLDPASGDAVEYSLAFTDGVLHGWKTRVHQKVGQALRMGEVPVTAADVPAAPPGKQVPKY
jgi:hypothetical protein